MTYTPAQARKLAGALLTAAHEVDGEMDLTAVLRRAAESHFGIREVAIAEHICDPEDFEGDTMGEDLRAAAEALT